MDVGERLPAQKFLPNERFVEIRFFHVDTDEEWLLFLIGLVESASLHSEVRKKLQYVTQDTPTEAKAILDSLMSTAVSISAKLSEWNNKVTKFMFYDLVCTQSGLIRDDLEETYGVHFQNYEEQEQLPEAAFTVYWGKVQGKLALLYLDYAVSSFGTWSCGHLFYRYFIFEQLQQAANGCAISGVEISAVEVWCDRCSQKVSDQVLKFLLNTQWKEIPEMCSGCGQAEDFVQESCSCRICANCVAILTLTKSKIECPLCAAQYSTDLQNKIREICLKITGVIRISQERIDPNKRIEEDAKDYMTQPFIPPPSVKIIGTCTCGRSIAKSDKIYCSNYCHCAFCLLIQYLNTGEIKCSTCSDDCLGLLSESFQCSECARSLLVKSDSVHTCVCAVCNCEALLCCFCINMKNGQFLCRICNQGVAPLRNPEEIIGIQKSFHLACFCGKPGLSETLICTHKAHKDCARDIIFCRICRHIYKKNVTKKLVSHYIS